MQHPREFATDLPLITGLVHARRLAHNDRLALCSADKQLIFVDVMRDSCKLAGKIKLDVSPLCCTNVVIHDDSNGQKEHMHMLAFGDDCGSLHLYTTHALAATAERNLMSVNSLKAEEARVRSWQAHDKHAWVNKMEYIADLRVLISCGSDSQIVLSDVIKGEIKADGLKHRYQDQFPWL